MHQAFFDGHEDAGAGLEVTYNGYPWVVSLLSTVR